MAHYTTCNAEGQSKMPQAFADDQPPFIVMKATEVTITLSEVCTLLITRNDQVSMEESLLRFDGKMNLLIQYLLECHSSDKSQTLKENYRTQYQKLGQKLCKKHFRVDSAVWHSLKLFARSLGVSMCLAFIILLQREMASSVIVPTKTIQEQTYFVAFVETLNIKTRVVTGKRRSRKKLLYTRIIRPPRLK